MSNQKIDFTDLVLLIGTNPLPNYAVAKYFLENNSKLQRIIMVCSKKNDRQAGTTGVADNLITVLNSQFSSRTETWIKKVELGNAGLSTAIEKDIRDMEVLDPSKNYHLNYTGGTKAMAVHVYRSLEKRLGEKISFSYLDAQNNRILLDGQDIPLNNEDLRTIVNIDFETLWAIHGYQKNTRQKEEYIDVLLKDEKNLLNPLMEAFSKLIGSNKSGNNINLFNNWAKNNQNKVKDAHGKTINPINKPPNGFDTAEAKNIIKACHGDRAEMPLATLLAAFPEGDRFCDEKGNWLVDNFGISGDHEPPKELNSFLTGKWLEAYVYYVLKKGFNENPDIKNRSEMVINWHVGSTSGPEDTELDIMIVNGYQFTGISCSTQDEFKKQKLKGFEILHRVEQVGGEEARAILITMLDSDNTKNLSRNLYIISGASYDNLLVVGKDDLPNLWEKIKSFIWDN